MTMAVFGFFTTLSYFRSGIETEGDEGMNMMATLGVGLKRKGMKE
jgi:hypothetical protein